VCCLIYKLQQRQQELGASNLLNKSLVGVEGLQCCCLFIHISDRRPGQYPRSFPSTNLETLLICDAFGIKLKTHVDIQDNGTMVVRHERGIASDIEVTSWPDLQTTKFLKSDIATWCASNSLAEEKKHYCHCQFSTTCNK
jgi:hypothetical protein